MTQRLETKIGTQGGLETNVQSDQSAGYQIADNVLYRPIGGVSKRRGSKKLVETVEGETKRLISPTQDGTGILSIQEDDSIGDAKVLGYKKEGTRVDLYCLDNSYFLTLDPESDFSAHDKVRLEFPEEIYTTDLSFIESAFEEKTGALSGFWTLQTSFTTIAVEQDSVDPDLLRVARFVNIPTKQNELTITASSLSVAPTFLVDYEIISVSADYFTIYPNLGAPAWTSTGDTGTINFTFQTLKIIELNSPALTTDSLLNQNVQCFYESNPSFKKQEVTFRYFNDKSTVVIDPGSNSISDLDVNLLAKNDRDGPLNLYKSVSLIFDQDNDDLNYLRVDNSSQGFPSANYPLKIQEYFFSNPTFFINPPTEINVYYDIVEFDGSFYYFYPTGKTPPAVKNFGGSGRLQCDFRTLVLTAIFPRTTSTFTEVSVLLYNFSKTLEEFTTAQTKTVLENRSGEEIILNADQGQLFLSSEDPSNPQIAFYGVPQAIDVLPYYFTSTLASGAARPLGFLTEQTRYAYKAVLKRKTNDQFFVGSPSPTFFLETADESASYTTLSGAQIGIDASGEVFFTLSGGGATNLLIQLKNVTSTPAISDFTSIAVYWEGSGTRYFWTIEDQISLLGSQVTSISQADVFLCKSSFCEVCLPETFFNDFKNNVNIDDFYVDLYRTVGVDNSSLPDTSQFFLCKSFEISDIRAPTIGLRDDEISDLDLESQLPLYTNPTEEGILKENSVAPQHQNFTEKNGVFYLGDLKKQQILNGNFSSNTRTAPSDPGIFTNTFTYTTLLSTYSSGFFNITAVTGGGFDGLSRRIYIKSGVVYDFENDSVLGSLYQNFVLSEFFTSISLSGYAVGEINYFYWSKLRPMNGSPSFQMDVQKATPKTFLSIINHYDFYILLSINGTFSNEKITISIQTRNFREVETTDFLKSFNYFEDTFGAERFRYQIAYSKPFEPAAFPSLQFLNVGSTKNIVYGIFKVRDSLLIASKEGFYRLTGDNELDYVITLIEADTTPLTPLLMTEQQDRVLSLTQKGLAACSESSLEIIDTPIQDITERFLQLYRDDLDSFTVKQTYTAAPKFLNQVVFYMPTLSQKDTSQSTFGLSFDTSYNRFATVDLYVDDQEKTGVLSQAFDASRFSNESYSSPSFEPSSLQVVRASVNRSDFAQNQAFIELGTFWECDASIIAGSSILTLTTGLDHRFQPGDYVTLISGEAFVTVGTGLSASLFANAVHSALIGGGDPRVFSIDLGSISGESVSNKVRFRFGRAGLPATISLTSGSLICTLTLASQADVGWLVGQKIYLQKPYDLSLASIENFLNNSKNITSKVPNTIEFSLPAASPITTSAPCIFSEDLRDPYKQTFSFVAPSFVNNQSFAFKYLNDRLLYPFEKENTGARIQGFLERPWDIQYKPDRPSLVFDSVKSTIQTSRITGGDPCSLKNFGQIILSMQSIFSMTKCILAFQGDRYDAAGSITFRSQNQLDQPFDPAFADTLWSAIAQQWSSITNSDQGWKEAGPFTPIRITTPTNVAQSTYLSIYILHDRPFETMAFGSIAVNGTFIDPTSSGV